jgi:sterol desaturase/sphingolipid hydroxylase (fatty acid hydroxylase superfamily)
MDILILKPAVQDVTEILLAPASSLFWGWILLYVVIGVTLNYRRTNSPRGLLNSFRSVFPKKNYFNRSALWDVTYALVHIFLMKVILWGLLSIDLTGSNIRAGLEVGLAVIFGAREAHNVSGVGMDIFFSLSLFLAFELAYFSYHYAAHSIPFLWTFHKTHHSATSLNIMTVSRFHSVDLLFTSLWIAVFMTPIIFGFRRFGYYPTEYGLWGIPILTFAFHAISIFRHSHIRVSFGPLDRFLISPVMHQVHHSSEPAHINKNMGQYLTIFDRMMGTHYIPAKEEKLTPGLGHEKAGHEMETNFFYYNYLVLPRQAWNEFIKMLNEDKVTQKAERKNPPAA